MPKILRREYFRQLSDFDRGYITDMSKAGLSIGGYSPSRSP